MEPKVKNLRDDQPYKGDQTEMIVRELRELADKFEKGYEAAAPGTGLTVAWEARDSRIRTMLVGEESRLHTVSVLDVAHAIRMRECVGE